MYFDLLAGIVENHLPELSHILHEAKLFIFPGRAHDVLPKQVTQEEIDFLHDQFFLPFPIIAVEDTGSCVLFIDETENVIGSNAKRKFIECQPIDVNPDEYDDNEQIRKEMLRLKKIQKFPQGSCIVSFGDISNFSAKQGHERFQFEYDGSVSTCLAASKHQILFSPIKPPSDAAKSILRNSTVAFQEIMYFNHPSRFVVETSPKKMRDKPKRIQRSHERPIYTMLTPKEIRTTLGMGNPESNKRSPIAHERRRHFRTYRADRFKHMKGKTIVIPATWIGPTEAKKGNKIYKVMLDL